MIMTPKSTFETSSATETELLGRRLAAELSGQKIFLFGGIGVGKTTFLRGLAAGLGVRSKIKSPTFVGEHCHQTAHGESLTHFDFYRTENCSAEILARLTELFADKNATVAIEWSERIPQKMLPHNRIELRFTELKNGARQISLSSKVRLRFKNCCA